MHCGGTIAEVVPFEHIDWQFQVQRPRLFRTFRHYSLALELPERLTMRIAQVAPLYESVPPKCYGGTERVVSFLTEELVRQGHKVTLFASGDSQTRAKLVAACPQALRLDAGCVDSLAHHLILLERVFEQASC